jgi:hypothetical protein
MLSILKRRMAVLEAAIEFFYKSVLTAEAHGLPANG